MNSCWQFHNTQYHRNLLIETNHSTSNRVIKEVIKWVQLTPPNDRGSFGLKETHRNRKWRRNTVLLKNDVVLVLKIFLKRIVPKKAFLSLYCHIFLFKEVRPKYFSFQCFAPDHNIVSTIWYVINFTWTSRISIRIAFLDENSRQRGLTLIGKWHSFKVLQVIC